MPDHSELDELVEMDELVRAANPATGHAPVAIPRFTLPSPAGGGPGRYRGMLSVSASAIAVVAVTVLAVAVGNATIGGGQTGHQQPAGDQERPAVPTAPATGTGTAPPSPGPTGDHTAHSGPQYDRARALLLTLQASLPTGYTTPPLALANRWPVSTEAPITAFVTGPGPTGLPLKSASALPAASFEATFGETTPGRWDFDAMTDASRGGRTGTFTVAVYHGVAAGEPCAFAMRYTAQLTGCQVVTTRGADVAVITEHDQGGRNWRQVVQWVFYRNSSGAVIVLGQSKVGSDPAKQLGLTSPIFTTDQLATLATDPRFAL